MTTWNRRELLAAGGMAAGALLGTGVWPRALGQQGAGKKRPNVLFLAIDDLNHWVGHLARNEQTRTPRIDALAARGVTFRRAYCAAPVCNPSRAALMSGLRPHRSGVYENRNDWRRVIPMDKPMTAAFRRGGYSVLGCGKIYHGGFERREEWDDYMKGGGGGDPRSKTPGGVGGIRFARLDCKDEDLHDYQIADWAIEQLGRKHDKPFFLACGVHLPHMPWSVPGKWFDMFPLESIKLPPYLESDLDDVPPAGVKMAKPDGDHATMLKSGRWKEAVQAYLAAIAYTDMNVGRVIAALEASAYKDNTIICLWGDHGWHLGEKRHWRKFALWEEATRAPLVFAGPGLAKGTCERTVDFMSIYPTLCELCGLDVPAHVQDPSIAALLRDPAGAWDRPAMTTYTFKNHTVRSETHRYIRYANGDEELYDEQVDPYEWKNLAGHAKLAKVKADLATHLPKSDAADIGNDRTDKGKGKKKGKQQAAMVDEDELLGYGG